MGVVVGVSTWTLSSWFKPPNGFVKNSCGFGTTQQSALCDDDNNNDNIDDNNNNGNVDDMTRDERWQEMTNNKDHVCGQCCKADHSCSKDFTRRGEIALVMTISKAQNGC